MSKVIVGVVILLIVGSGTYWFLNRPPQSNPLIQTSQITPSTETDFETEVVAENMEVPWALAFLPDGTLLATEREGRLNKIEGGKAQLIHTFSEVKQAGEGGMHGLAVDPSFKDNQLIYLYYTYTQEGNQTLNRVIQAKLVNNKLTDIKTLVDAIPGAKFHDGGRLKFGPDRHLYITTGDAQEPSLAQDKNSLAGKILRIANGQAKAEVYSYGHRNPQGITWDDKGNLWSTEHGPSGGTQGTGRDELNMIIQGRNYGWPTIMGDQAKSGLETPVIHSGSDTWAPGGIAYLSGSLFFAGLRGSALYEYKTQSKQLVTHFKNTYGRIRDVVVGPDNSLYITTSNKDGRGVPKSGDDKIIRVNPKQLPEQKEFTATFEITTLGTKRIFTDPKYHNRSDDVYIQANNPSVIYVKKSGVNWSDFFNSLPPPMKLTKECLTTGTNQTFCNNSTQRLKFILNDKENPDALVQKIKSNDKLNITYD